MQLDLLPRQQPILPNGAVLLQDWLPIDQQQALLTLIRAATQGGWYTPTLPDGPPLRHPIACLGLQWKPYEYFDARVRVPGEIVLMAISALKDAGLSQYIPYQPDTAIVNYFPHGSNLGMHQDKSEDQAQIDAGSPIITVSLGDSCIFRLGNNFNREAPYTDAEFKSGDCFIMHDGCRSAFHGVMKILPGTAPADLDMKPGRISITIREAFPPKKKA